MSIELDDLVHSSDKMLMDIQGDADLPMITRSLKQMRQLGERLYKTRGPQGDIKAARLLGSKMSYELPNNLLEKLETKSFDKDYERTVSLSDVDIQTFLKSEQENALLKAFEDIRTATYIETDLRTEDAISSWWEQEKLAILSSLANASDPLNTDVYYSMENNTENDINVPLIDEFGQPQPSFTLEELCYARKLNQYLSEKMATKKLRSHLRQLGTPSQHQQDPIDLLSCLSAAMIDNTISSKSNQMGRICLSNKQQSGHFSEIEDVWNLLRHLIEGDTLLALQACALPMSGFSASTRAIKARTSPQLQKSLITWALNHLHTEFSKFMRAVVADQPVLARLGGHPGTRALVRAFINVRYPWTNGYRPGSSGSNETMVSTDSMAGRPFNFEDGSVDGKPVWMMIYFCLRAGDVDDAVEIAKSAGNNLGDFYLTLVEFSKSGYLPSHLLPTVRENYRRLVKNSADPYKRCVYCLICRCDLDDVHEEVAASLDDFLWFRLSQVTVDNSLNNQVNAKESTHGEEILTLAQFQNLLYETYGESHFEAWRQPLIYFKLLLLTQQFEGALGFLARFDNLRCHAVHIGLVLVDLGLLVLSSTVHAPLVTKSDSVPNAVRRLNLARLVLLYTRKFELTNPREALAYYHFLSGVCLAAPAHTSANIGSSLTEGCQRGGLLYLLDQSSVMSRHRANQRGGVETDDDDDGVTGDADDALRLSNRSLFVLCTCELALATKEFSTLFGYLDECGKRKPGVIDQFCPNEYSREQLISYAAEAVEARGQLMDAIRLYQLAAATSTSEVNEFSTGGAYGGSRRHSYLTKATILINQLLLHAITTSGGIASLCGDAGGYVGASPGSTVGQLRVGGANSERTAVIQLATELAHRLRELTTSRAAWRLSGFGETRLMHSSMAQCDDDELGEEVADDNSAALFYLLDLTTFFDLTAGERWASALEHMDQLGLLPAGPEPERVDACIATFTRLPDIVRRTLSTALLCLMRCLVARARTIRTGGSSALNLDTSVCSNVLSNANINMTMNDLRNRAKALIAYTGRIPYRMPGELYAKLTQMEMELV